MKYNAFVFEYFEYLNIWIFCLLKDQNPSEVVTISSETEENLECDQSDESGDADQISSASGGSET